LQELNTNFVCLIRDNDSKYTEPSDTVFESEGINIICTPFKAPNANTFAERWVRTLRTECLDNNLILNESHLCRVLGKPAGAEHWPSLTQRSDCCVAQGLHPGSSHPTTAREFGIRLVNGVAGSGKSLIIVYRTYLLRQLFPNKRILVLTHNRLLIRDLQARYLQLSDRSVQWYTFLGWCRRYWSKDVTWQKTAGYQKRRELITQAWHEHLADTAVAEQMLQEEIDWFKDRLLFGRLGAGASLHLDETLVRNSSPPQSSR
jgi:hypothetical protein